MRLSVNLIANRRCYQAGEEIPDDVEIPAFGKKFAVTEENGNGEASADFVPTAREGQAASAAAPKPPVKRKRYVQRGSSWKRTRMQNWFPVK